MEAVSNSQLNMNPMDVEVRPNTYTIFILFKLCFLIGSCLKKGPYKHYIKLLEFGKEPSSVGQLRNWALCKLSFEPDSINSQKK